MPPVDRFSVSLDTELLAAFDGYIADRGYHNRSEAIRDVMRDSLLASRPLRGRGQVVAALFAVCDHREGEIPKRLRACLAAHGELVAGWLTVPVDEHRDALIVGLRGEADPVQSLADEIQAMRGVTYGRFSAVPTDETK